MSKEQEIKPEEIYTEGELDPGWVQYWTIALSLFGLVVAAADKENARTFGYYIVKAGFKASRLFSFLAGTSERYISNLHSYSQMLFVVLIVVIILNIISIMYSFRKTSGNESRYLQIVSAVFTLAALLHLWGVAIFRYKDIPTRLGLIFFVLSFVHQSYVLITRIKKIRSSKAGVKKSYLIPVFIAVPILLFAVIYPVKSLFEIKGYTNYLNDRPAVNTEGDNDLINSENGAAVINDTVYCVVRSDDSYQLIKVDKNGSTEIIDQDGDISRTMVVASGDLVFYTKMKDEAHYVCCLNTVTGEIHEHISDLFGGSIRGHCFMGVIGNKLCFEPIKEVNGCYYRGMYFVDIADGDIDMDTIEEYAWYYDLPPHHGRYTTFYNVFIRGDRTYTECVHTGDYIVDLYEGIYDTPTLVSSDKIYRRIDYLDCSYVHDVVTYNVYNDLVYYVVEGEDSYEIYRCEPDLSSPELIATAEGDKSMYIIVSDTYLVCVTDTDISTIPLV